MYGEVSAQFASWRVTPQSDAPRRHKACARTSHGRGRVYRALGMPTYDKPDDTKLSKQSAHSNLQVRRTKPAKPALAAGGAAGVGDSSSSDDEGWMAGDLFSGFGDAGGFSSAWSSGRNDGVIADFRDTTHEFEMPENIELMNSKLEFELTQTRSSNSS